MSKKLRAIAVSKEDSLKKLAHSKGDLEFIKAHMDGRNSVKSDNDKPTELGYSFGSGGVGVYNRPEKHDGYDPTDDSSYDSYVKESKAYAEVWRDLANSLDDDRHDYYPKHSASVSGPKKKNKTAQSYTVYKYLRDRKARQKKLDETRIEELSKETLGSYVKKNGPDKARLSRAAAQTGDKNLAHKFHNRMAGLNRALPKLAKKKACNKSLFKLNEGKLVSKLKSILKYKEKGSKPLSSLAKKAAGEKKPVLAEISKATLASYVAKATSDMKRNAKIAGKGPDFERDDDRIRPHFKPTQSGVEKYKQYAAKRALKRFKGLGHASNKLTVDESIMKSFRANSRRQSLENKARSEFHDKANLLSALDKVGMDKEAKKVNGRVVQLGKRLSALKKDGSGNYFMSDWPKKPKDLRYMGIKEAFFKDLKKATGATTNLGAVGAGLATVGTTAAAGALVGGGGFAVPGATIGALYALKTLRDRMKEAKAASVNESFKGIVTKKNKDGSYDEVGMNNRTIVKGSIQNIRKHADNYAKGPHRLELYHADKIYGPAFRTEYSDGYKKLKEEDVQLDELSSKTLYSYLNKAQDSKDTLERRAKHSNTRALEAKSKSQKTKNYKDAFVAAWKADKRTLGIERAKDRAFNDVMRVAPSLRRKSYSLTEDWDKMSHEAKELVLHADSDGHLHQTSHQPIMANLHRKAAKGKYDHEKSKQLWLYHADRAAQNYVKTVHGAHEYFDKPANTPWHKVFTMAHRREAAKHWADYHKDEFENHKTIKETFRAKANIISEGMKPQAPEKTKDTPLYKASKSELKEHVKAKLEREE